MTDPAAERLASLVALTGGMELVDDRQLLADHAASAPVGHGMFVGVRSDLSKGDLIGVRDEIRTALIVQDRVIGLEKENRLLTEQVDALLSALSDSHADESTIPATFAFLPSGATYAVLKDGACLVNRGVDEHSLRVEAKRMTRQTEHRCRIGEGERFVYGLAPYAVVVDAPSPIDSVRCQLIRLTVSQLASNQKQREQHELIKRVRDLVAATMAPTVEVETSEAAIENGVEEHVSQLIEETLRDSLTRVYNRSKITAVAAELEERGTPYSVVMADIDHFKLVNDTFGHLAGDRVIVEVAACLELDQRDDDVVARWGGEEFIAILPRTSLAEAADLAERWRSLVEDKVIASDVPVSCSFGVATLSPGQTMEQLINRADTALYRAKELGRNRVEVHAPGN